MTSRSEANWLPLDPWAVCYGSILLKKKKIFKSCLFFSSNLVDVLVCYLALPWHNARIKRQQLPHTKKEEAIKQHSPKEQAS